MLKKMVVGILIASVFLVSCKSDDDSVPGIGNEPKPIITDTVAMPRYKTYLSFEFVDASSGEHIKNKNVTVKIGGKNANNVAPLVGKSTESYTVAMGVLGLVIKNKADGETVEFLVTANCPGYAEYTKRMVISDAEFVPISINMTNLTKLPDGVSLAQSNNFTNAENGVVKQTAVATLDGGHSKLTIAEGTKLKDAAGNLISGTVQSQILFYNPKEEVALGAFPGGLDVQATLPDGSTGDIIFMSAGVFDVNMNVGGKAVKSFEGDGVILTTEIDKNMINPKTEQPMKEGDEIELWSMDAGTGKWAYEKTAKVKRNDQGLYLEESISHLSSWNWDWFQGDFCYTGGAKIKWEGNATGVTFNVDVTNSSGGYLKSTAVYADVNDSYYNNMVMNYVPRNTPVKMKFSSRNCDGDLTDLIFTPAELNIANLCEAKTYSVTVTNGSTASPSYTVIVSMTASIPSLDVVILPNAWMYYYDTQCYNYNYINMNNGQIILEKLKTGRTYEVSGSFGSIYGYGTVAVDDIGNNQLKVVFTPTYYYNYTGSMPEIKTKEIIIPKPTNQTIRLDIDMQIPEELVNSIM